ncbi:ABC transporter permease [Ahrensia marina]|uniref:ABC transporter permease n=1 Tax=Ahrensia marina TaxID=1514904 RepID=UPI0035CFE121
MAMTTDTATPLGPDDAPAIVDAQGAEVAGQWKLMWWKFRRHKLAMASGVVVLLLYLIAIFAEVLAPADPNDFSPRYTYAPPQELRWSYVDDAGERHWGLHVNDYRTELDRETFRRTFVLDEDDRIPVGFFVEGEPYLLLGFIPASLKLFGPKEVGAPFYIWGADRLGRDMFSRVIHGARVSLSIGLVGVFLSLFLGVVLGGISGYYGGWIDTGIQRLIEFIRSIPTIPLWMGLAAAIPLTLHPLMVYLIITAIVSLVGWTDLGREVRGRFLSIKDDDYVAAARLDGASEPRIILRHMAPSFLSHIIATVTLAIPTMILAETALSFLGIGLRPPVVSWGVLLQEAQNIRAVVTAPWLMVPGGAVVVAVLAFNFLGDGLRDAADPYSN